MTGLPSIIERNGELPEGETLGPSDIVFKGKKDFVLSIGIGGSDAFRESCPDGDLLGTLVSGKVGKDNVKLFADVLAYEAAANPGGDDIDSNPVGLLRRGGAYVVADAGGNAVVRASHKGVFTTVTVIPRAPAAAAVRGRRPRPDVGRTGARRCGLRQPADGVPIHPRRRQHLAGRAGECTNGVRIRAHQRHRPGLRQRRLAVRRGDRFAGSAQWTDRIAGPDPARRRDTDETVAGGLFAPYGVALTKHAAYVTTGAVLVGGGELLKIPLDRAAPSGSGFSGSKIRDP